MAFSRPTRCGEGWDRAHSDGRALGQVTETGWTPVAPTHVTVTRSPGSRA